MIQSLLTMIITFCILAGFIIFYLPFVLDSRVCDLHQTHLKILQSKLVTEIATVKDGTVQFELPEDIKSHSLDFGAGLAYNDTIIEEHVDAIGNNVRPLQIVMLIVGTRGDVQPFIAIGKCLQVQHTIF